MGFKKQNSRKKAENGDFEVVGSLLYAHYPYIFLSFIRTICSSSMLCENTRKSLNQQIMSLAHFKILSFSDFSSMGVGLEKES